MVAVNPKNLIWARETAGLDVDEAAKKLRLGDSKKRTAIEKLELLESGKRQPTRAQLTKMAKAYHQPLLTFYLSEPPRKGDRGQDFRTLPQQTSDRKGNSYLDLLMRNVKAAQSLVRDLLDEEEFKPLPFINSATTTMSYEVVAQDIAKILEFDLKQYRTKSTFRDAFIYLRDCIESKGIFVLLMSDLGSRHSTIPVKVFRGFAFADEIAPFIVINHKDALSALSFTALHEVVHLWLGTSGISGEWGELEIEQYCNRVAGTLLLPSNDLSTLATLQHATLEDAVVQINDFARQRKISRAMVAYNLQLENQITWSRWKELQHAFDQERKEQEQREKEQKKGRNGGPDANVVRRFHLGHSLVKLAKRSVDAGILSPTKAGIILGVNPRRVEAILNP